MPDLLIELFSEEIPARMQRRASEDLKALVTDGLVEAGLTYAAAAAFATPRRLALSVEGLSGQSRATREERKGPATTAPDKAVEGFLRSTGLTRDQLQVRDAGKGQAYFAVIDTPGRPAAAIVAEVLEAAIRRFPWPKSMRWGTSSLRWVRPLHAILCILSDEAGAEVVPLEIEGLVAGATTRGHRFMAPQEFSVTSFENYEAKLKRAKVILRPEERAEAIWHDATNRAFAEGLEVVEDRGLLEEVAGLVEWPVVLMGRIGEAFLDLPPEVLQTSMKAHQKFFSVRNPATGRIEGFVTVANIETIDDGATILAGNGKVLAARLSDARFFWENDLAEARAGMGGWRAANADVTFHNKLGFQADKVARVAALAEGIAPMVGADPALARQAAEVAKLDLRSEMVGEFPELQGVMGRYYAQAAGLPAEVAAAAQEHYAPLGPSDTVPSAPISVAVALADKIDTLTGFWWISDLPSGSKDPFALRRAGLGAMRLILVLEKKIELIKLLKVAFSHLKDQGIDPQGWPVPDFLIMEYAEGGHVDYRRAGYSAEAHASAHLIAFLHDRLKVHLRERGIRHDVIDACLAMPGADDLVLLVKRAEALQAVLETEDGTNLVQGFKRANNILAQAEARDGVEYSFGPDRNFAESAEETALFDALDAAEARIAPAMEAEDFAAAMAAMAELRAPIDAFFEAVQVNAENQILRRNRLNLLNRIRTTCGRVADLTRIEG